MRGTHMRSTCLVFELRTEILAHTLKDLLVKTSFVGLKMRIPQNTELKSARFQCFLLQGIRESKYIVGRRVQKICKVHEVEWKKVRVI